jgi:hypothetical protein
MPKHRSAPPPEAEAQDDSPEQMTLNIEVQRLIVSGREAFASEMAFQKARAALAGKLVGRIAGLGALALALLFFVLMALVVGSLIALAPVIGAWAALGVVVLVQLVLIAACALLALLTVRALKRVIKDKPDSKAEDQP